MISRIGWFAALAAVLLASTGCVDRKAQEQGKETLKVVSDPAIAVAVAVATTRDVPDILSLTGALKTSGDVQVSAKASGRIESVLVRDGDDVRAGQLIARLEGVEAQARLSQAQASAAASKSQLDTAETEAKSAPTRTTATVRAAQARVASAQEQLARLRNGSRSAERAQARNNVDRAKSDLDYAQTQFDRAQRLFDQGASSKSDLELAQNRRDQAKTAYQNAIEQFSLIQDSARPEDIAVAEQAIRQAQEDLRTAQANKQLDPQFQQRVDVARANYRSSLDQVRLAQQAVADLRVTAPTSGRITGTPLQPGTVVSPGLGIARIVNLGGVYYNAEVSEANVAKVHQGQPVTVKLDALPGVTIQGHVTSVETVASSVGRLYNVRVDLDQKPAQLRSGMFAQGEALIGNNPGAVVVPSNSLVVEADKSFVYVVQANNKVKKTPVKVIGTVDGQSAVSGINSGDKVVLKGQNLLAEGTLVKIQDKPAGA